MNVNIGEQNNRFFGSTISLQLNPLLNMFNSIFMFLSQIPFFGAHILQFINRWFSIRSRVDLRQGSQMSRLKKIDEKCDFFDFFDHFVKFLA